MKLLLAGGGTGGHLFPAVALAQGLLKQDSSSRVHFVGTAQGLESRLLPKLGLPLATIDMTGFVGRGVFGKIMIMPKLLRSVRQSRRILRYFQPDLVVGVGGYASVPVLLAAKMLRIPYLIHEQNAVPGLGNKFLSRWAESVCLSFAESDNAFAGAQTLVTGNPLRQGLELLPELLPENGTLLIFGGSRGAQAINRCVVKMLPKLVEQNPTLRILHQTGEEDLNEVRQGYADAGVNPNYVVPFIDDMASAYADAELVICRAGATTIAELTVCGRPAILIPYPYAAGDHQTENARSLAEAGAACMLPQTELTPEGLALKVSDLLGDRKFLEQMAHNARQMGQPGATLRILQECERLIAKGKDT
ncbi:MAG TPA: undecaprenyldiphospho-muramoylpentapeptide beta-N-acetylglucosaminyltransferase [Geopsychrobacteraceae bacterium]|nr:undecaprenyldiphospho-muramoylpentapeptide beta-N-acetylglucosaminyltransferase [Geopsychrobacteraceae bacterium]